MLVAATTARCESSEHLALSAENTAPELTAIATIADKFLVCIVFDGEHHMLTDMGATVGPYKLKSINAEASYVDLERQDEVVRIWLRAPKLEKGELNEDAQALGLTHGKSEQLDMMNDLGPDLAPMPVRLRDDVD